ncbi:MAG: molybdopterin-dependent oxidoreductase, partial [Candidatus Methylomirabilis sp.]|nr:molybdopterin-dependent oxidoreductase [Deltaproteobacteria bacterium]
MERVVHRTCTWCEACCGITVRVEDERIVDIRGDEEDPFSRGYICPKAYALKELHEDPDRLRHPVKRTSTGWERVSWKEALDYAAEGLLAVQEKHGRDAAAVYLGNPNVHNVEAILFAQETVRALGTRNRFSASTLDQMPKQMVQHFLYGSGLFFSVPDVDRTAYMLILGANPLASNGSLMTAPDMRRRLQRIRDRGGKVVLVDPRRTESAKVADRHYFIRPGMDALLVAAMIQTLFAEDRVRLGRLASFTDGVETLRRELADFTPEAVAPRVGVGAEEIRRVAREFSEAESAVCYGRMGASTVRFGAAATWLIEALNVLTGNLDRPGGMMFPTPCVDVLKLQPRTRYGRWRSRTRGAPEFMGELPAATLADEIETAGEGQVRALLTVAGNPVLSSPAGHKLSDALAKLDFMVSVDFYVNETTRHARVILPPVGPLEHDHYDMAFQLLAVRN